MKKEDIDKTKEGELEEVTGFHYVSGKGFASLERDPSPEEIREEIQSDLEKELCPRDGGEFKKQKDGRTSCEKCGLILTDEVMKKFGIKNSNERT